MSAENKESGETALPAWRKELNEKVAAIKARRSSPDGSYQPDEEPATEIPAQQASIDKPTRNLDGRPGRRPPAREAVTFAASGARGLPARLDPAIDAQPIATQPATAKSSNAIVEAALTRVRRASETASRAALPKIEPTRPLPISIDREATARSLETAAVFEVKADLATVPCHKADEPVRERLEKKAFNQPEPVIAAPQPVYKSSRVAEADFKTDTLDATGPIDEIEPLDYLEAEIKKIDKARSLEFNHDESPTAGMYLVGALADLIVIAISCAPFIALIEIMNGNLASLKTRMASGAIVFIVAVFYLAVTQSLSGKSFGMMMTNTRLVSSGSSQAPSAQRIVLRSIFFLLAAAPGLVGLLWALGNRKRRAWHDLLTGTRIVRDF